MAIPPLEDTYLDFYGCSAELERLGFGKVSFRQVRRMADQNKLPFFRGMDGRRYIARSVLHECMRLRQDAARYGEHAEKFAATKAAASKDASKRKKT